MQNRSNVKLGPGRPKDDAKAEAIMEAAGHLFMTHGMSHVTMDDIADQAGVSKLTIYNHFGNKEDLFQAVIHKKCEAHLSQDLFAHLDGHNPSQDLYEIGRAFINIIFSKEALAIHRTVMSESRNNDKVAQLFFEAGPQRVYNQFVTYLEKLEGVKNIKIRNKNRVADMFFALFKGDLHMRALLQIKPPPDTKDFDKLTRENVDFFLTSILK